MKLQSALHGTDRVRDNHASALSTENAVLASGVALAFGLTVVTMAYAVGACIFMLG